MKKAMQLLALVLVLALIPVIPAMAEDSTTPWGLDKSETYVIQVMGTPVEGWTRFSETQVGQVILDKFNIDFEYVPFTGTTMEKQNLLLVGGDYYDLQAMESAVTRAAYVDAGALLPLDDYLDKMTNFTKLFEQQIPYWRAAAPDGKLYYWNSSVPSDVVTGKLENNAIAVRADALALWTDKYGFDNPPVYADDYVEMLSMAMEAGLTDVYGSPVVGLTSCWGESWGLSGAVNSFYENCSSYYASNNRPAVYNLVTNEWVSKIDQPLFKEQVEFFNRLYNAGALDEEAFTDMYSQTVDKAKIASPIAFWYISWEEANVNSFIREAGHPEMQYVKMPCVSAVDGPASGKELHSLRMIINDFRCTGITKNAKYPERIAELIDWLCTEEGAFLMYNGVQGVNWDYNAETGLREFIEEDYIRRTRSTDPADTGYDNMVGANTLTGITGINYDMIAEDGYAQKISQTEEHKAKWSDPDYLPNQVRAQFGWGTSEDWLYENTVAITAPEYADNAIFETGSDLAILNQKIQDIRVNNLYDVITAEDFEAAWQKMMDEYYASEYQQVLDGYNALNAEIIASIKGAE